MPVFLKSSFLRLASRDMDRQICFFFVYIGALVESRYRRLVHRPSASTDLHLRLTCPKKIIKIALISLVTTSEAEGLMLNAEDYKITNCHE